MLKLLINESNFFKNVAVIALPLAVVAALVSTVLQSEKVLIIFVFACGIFTHIWFQFFVLYYYEKRERLLLHLPLNQWRIFLYRYLAVVLLQTILCLVAMLVAVFFSLAGFEIPSLNPLADVPILWSVLLAFSAHFYWQKSMTEWLTENAPLPIAVLGEYFSPTVTVALVAWLLAGGELALMFYRGIGVMWENGSLFWLALTLAMVQMILDYFFYSRRTELNDAHQRSLLMRLFNTTTKERGN